ncbi:MAG: SpoIIE family protein phosphatase [Synechococcus sp.]
MHTILVIDDDITIQLTLKRLLRKQGYEVAIAADGRTGLERAIALKPAAIICDWMMPGLSGPEVCRRVKAIPQLSASFFILLTAFDTVEDLVHGLDAGADDFLTKPPNVAELQARIRTGCRSYELKRGLQAKTKALEVGLAETANYVRSLLPVPMSGRIDLTWEYLPTPHLGGNGFQGYWLDDDTFVVFMLDVEGDGIGSALQAAKLMDLLKSRSLADIDFVQPAQVLQALHHYLRERARRTSIWYGVYNLNHMTATYASAGHPPAFLLDGDGLQPLNTPYPALGSDDSTQYEQVSLEVGPSNVLYLHSAGLLAGEPSDASTQILVAAHQQESSDRVLSSWLERVRHTHSDGWKDDVSLVRVQLNG